MTIRSIMQWPLTRIIGTIFGPLWKHQDHYTKTIWYITGALYKRRHIPQSVSSVYIVYQQYYRGLRDVLQKVVKTRFCNGPIERNEAHQHRLYTQCSILHTMNHMRNCSNVWQHCAVPSSSRRGSFAVVKFRSVFGNNRGLYCSRSSILTTLAS